MERIKVYTHDDCKICIEVKEELNNNNILFEEKPILKFEQDAYDKEFGKGGIPGILRPE